MSASKRYRNKHGVSTWLVTWIGAGRESNWEGKIAAVLSPRLSSERVKEIVAVLYSTSVHPLADQIQWAKQPSSNPYKAQYGRLNGIPWEGEIFCGGNPMLEARLVDELRIEDGRKPVWQERPRPKIPALHTT